MSARVVRYETVSDPARDPDRNPPEVEAAYEAAPPEMVAEILDGELFVLPRPRLRHARGASRLGRYPGPFDDDTGPGGWILLDEPELHLGKRPDKLVPDLAGWRRERLPALPDEAACTVPSDWVCEVVSPGTEALDRGRKLRIYRREAVRHYWLLDPELETLEVYRWEGGRYTHLETYEGAARVRAEPFDAIELDLALLWAR